MAKLVTDFGVYPHATITGRGLPAVDTGVDVHWPGPGRVYLHPQDVADAVRVCHQHEDVAGMLQAEGWVRQEAHAVKVAELTARAERAEEAARAAGEKLAQVLATVALLQPDAPAEATNTPTPVAPDAVPVKRGPGRPRKGL